LAERKYLGSVRLTPQRRLAQARDLSLASHPALFLA
jgi:hypothetical protein